MHITRRIFPALIAASIPAAILSAQVITYPAPEGTEASPHYRVEVLQEGKSYRPFVYVSHAQFPRFNRSETTSYSIFSFTGKATILITKVGGDFRECTILPSSYGILAEKEGPTAVFTMEGPQKVAVEFDGDITHPLLLFADEPEMDIPSPDDPDVIWFGPGNHTPDKAIVPESGQTIYLSGGAVVNALIRASDVSDVTVRGKGILNGRIFGHTGGRHILFSGNCRNITIRDITIVDSPGFYVTTRGTGTHVRNIKGLGWWFNTDGIATGENSLIEDCFLKCNDDAIKLYHSNTEVYRTTIWQMENGAPFQISWNMPSDNSHFIVKDCDVIHCDHAWDNPNTAVFDAIHGGRGHMSDYLFEDIRIENCDWRLFSIQVRPNKFSRSDTLGRISRLHFKDISVVTPDGNPMKRINLFQGYDRNSMVTEVVIENLRINGELIRDANQGRFEIEPNTTAGFRFVATGEDLPVKCEASKPERNVFRWENPIWNTGLNSYGASDFFIWKKDDKYFLLATEVPNNEWGQRGIILYSSHDLVHWIEDTYLINRRSVDVDAWYKDGFGQPELHRINGKYYLIFSAYNHKNNPYGRTGLCVAVADDLRGPYRIMNPEASLTYGSNFTLLLDGGEVYAYWDLDGRFYTARMDTEKGTFASEPHLFLGPEQMGDDYRFLDAPCIYKRDNTYYLISSSFYAGYVIRVRYFTSYTPEGPWTMEPEPLMVWKEDEADMEVKMPWPKETPFPPPTQVIFHHHLFTGPGNKTYIAYHSSEKYSEPYLVIEPVEFDPTGRILLPANKEVRQKVEW